MRIEIGSRQSWRGEEAVRKSEPGRGEGGKLTRAPSPGDRGGGRGRGKVGEWGSLGREEGLRGWSRVLGGDGGAAGA